MNLNYGLKVRALHQTIQHTHTRTHTSDVSQTSSYYYSPEDSRPRGSEPVELLSPYAFLQRHHFVLFWYKFSVVTDMSF